MEETPLLTKVAEPELFKIKGPRDVVMVLLLIVRFVPAN